MSREEKLRTARRMSHVFVIDLPGYPRPLFVTDAAIIIYPTLEDKVDIVQNAIDLAHVLGLMLPKVAILSAVETVSSKIKSTIDAAALCKMADRGQITGGILDGPLAFDNAVSAEAAKTKGIVSKVAGYADILVVPDVEAGNMLAKQLEYLAKAEVAGIVLGARVPIILTSRADKTLARLSSCAIALLLARHTDGNRAVSDVRSDPQRRLIEHQVRAVSCGPAADQERSRLRGRLRGIGPPGSFHREGWRRKSG